MRICHPKSLVVLFVLVGGLGCVPQAPPPVEPAQATAYEPVWEAVLASFRGSENPGDADRRLPGLLHPSAPAELPPLRVALREWRDSGLASYRTEWLAGLVQRSLVDSICSRNEKRGCGGKTLTSLITLGDPQFGGDSAVITVADYTMNPASCRGVGGGFFGVHFQSLTLRAGEGGRWVVERRSLGMTGSGFCGEPDPATVRFQREFERVTRKISPIAGTWRYVVTLQSGDSLIIIARTSRHPTSTIRERTAAETRDFEREVERPVFGYYLDGDCSFGPGNAYTGRYRDVDCHHAVSLHPVFRSRDSTVWRGESEAELSAWILLDSIPLRERLHDALGDEEDRDPSWFYMPGYWIRYRDGRLVYRWDVVRDGVPVLRIRGERISLEVLSEDE